MPHTSKSAVNMGFGNNIRRLRLSKKLSVEKLGLMIGVSGATISNYENENRGYTQRTLEKIADALGVKVSDLFPREDPEEIDRVLSENDKLIESWFDGYRSTPDLTESDKKDIIDILKIADKILEKKRRKPESRLKQPAPREGGQ